MMIKPVRLFCIFLFIAVLSQLVFSLTPIARYDVVPFQRINHGESFNFGVVAFSKDGIDRVELNIIGQGYSGTNPLVSNEMTYNPRTGVYEYWSAIDANDFSSDGIFHVEATVYGNDGGIRNLGIMNLTVDSTGSLSSPKAWVSLTGDDSTGELNNRNMPFATSTEAVRAIQNSNGGFVDGGTVYFFEGTHSLSGGSWFTPIANNEWITFTRDVSASIDNTIINHGSSVSYVKYIKIDGLTLTKGDGFIFSNDRNELWIDNSKIIGSGRYVTSSNPVMRSGEKYYATNTYIYDVEYGIHRGGLARNVTVEKVGNDAFVNTQVLINVKVNDMDPGVTSWHADGYQSWGEAPNNRIIYGYYGTDLHYQGLFMREEQSGSIAKNNAFVNIFMEMREPGRMQYTDGPLVLSAFSLSGAYDHILVWHCSFPYKGIGLYGDELESGYEFDITNSSFIGNYFNDFRSYPNVSVGHEADYTLYNNVQNNDFLYNHYALSQTDLPYGCIAGHFPAEENCPHIYSSSPDSSSDESTQSIGDANINFQSLIIGESVPDNFGSPLENSVLIDRIPYETVPVDVLGNSRDSTPDIGAIEFIDENNINDNNVSDDCVGSCASSLTQYGITWTFDKEYNYGQFVNGDYYVLDDGSGVNIIDINPKPINDIIYTEEYCKNHGGADDIVDCVNFPTSYLGEYEYTDFCIDYNCVYVSTRNGFMINPMPVSEREHYYDSRAMEYVYNADLSLPISIDIDSSFISTISQPDETQCIDDASRDGWYTYEGECNHVSYPINDTAILTVLMQTPPNNSFRPKYTGSDKKIYSANGLDYNLLGKLPLTEDTPTIEFTLSKITRPWVDHVPGWSGASIHSSYMKPYGRDIATDSSIIAMVLNMNYPNSEKELLLYKYIQMGIDNYGIIADGGAWPNDGGHAAGRKWPIIFAGIMLDNNDMKHVGSYDNTGARFGEDDQSFYVTDIEIENTNGDLWRPDIRAAVLTPYNNSNIGLPEWGIRHADNPYADNAYWGANYRLCCNGLAWYGFILSAQVMNAKSYWNHSALFDYQDRYFQVTKSDGPFPDWHSNHFASSVWELYRDNYGCSWKLNEPNNAYSQGHYDCDGELIRCGWMNSDVGTEINSCDNYPNERAFNYDPCNLNCSGSFNGYFHDADLDESSDISLTELNIYINSWRSSTSVTLANLIEAIRFWKSG